MGEPRSQGVGGGDAEVDNGEREMSMPRLMTQLVPAAWRLSSSEAMYRFAARWSGLGFYACHGCA